MNGTVLYRAHPHWRSIHGLGVHLKGALAGLMIGGILVGLGFGGVYSTGIGIALGIVAFVLASLFAAWFRKTTVYTVTRQTVRIDRGIINRRREEFSVRKVQSIDVQQNIIERFILKTGNISLDSASADRVGPTEILFMGVVRPHAVADIIRNSDDGYDNAGYDTYRQLHGMPPVQAPDTADPYGTGERPPAPVYRPHPGLPPR